MTARNDQPVSTEWPVAWPWRWFISALLLFHLMAVAAAPFAFQTRPSPVAELLVSVFSPYLEATYLNHGYAFFAPDPGESHLVRYRISFEEGREPIERQFPDLNDQWPRLLYHRHFMLSEWLSLGFVPSVPPPEVARSPMERQQWQRARELYLMVRNSYEDHLLSKYGGQEVTLTRWAHYPPTYLDVAQGRRQVTDQELFTPLPEDRPSGVPPWMR